MRHEAIIFDLFGTLVSNLGDGFCAHLQAEGLLKPLSAGREAEFTRLWESRDVRRMRTINILDTPADAIRYVCEQLGLTVDSTLLERVVEARMAWYQSAFVARPGIEDALAHLRRDGRKLALMSNSSAEAPWLWPRTDLSRYFEEMLFSCQTGLAMPHPRFYEIACERLGVAADRCLYVSSVEGVELTGARMAGMDALALADGRAGLEALASRLAEGVAAGVA